MKKIISATILSISALTFSNIVTVEANAFTDVSAGDWYAPVVSFVSENKIMTGSNSLFSPNKPATRGEVAQAFYNMASSNYADFKTTMDWILRFPAFQGQHSFTDISNSPNKEAIAWCFDEGVVNGVNSSTFSPNSNVTREEVAVIISNFWTYLGRGKTNIIPLESTSFVDKNDVSSWAVSGMSWVTTIGFINGDTSNRLNPKNNVTNAELATIIKNIAVNMDQHVRFEPEGGKNDDILSDNMNDESWNSNDVVENTDQNIDQNIDTKPQTGGNEEFPSDYIYDESWSVDGMQINLTTAEFSKVKITDDGVTFTNTEKSAYINGNEDVVKTGYIKAGDPLYNFLKDINSVNIYAVIDKNDNYDSAFTIANKGEGANLDKKVANGTMIKITNNFEFVNAMAVTAYTNQARYENGMDKFNIQLNRTLFDACVAKGKEMLAEGHFAHANKAGVHLSASVNGMENIAIDGNLSQATTFMSIKNNAKSLVDQWMGSTGHRANILIKGHTIMGASITSITNDVYASSIDYTFTKGAMGVIMFR